MTEAELEALTIRHLPEQLLRALVRSVFLAHKRVWDDCSRQFAETEAENVRPFYRRALLEGLIRGVAARYEGVTTEVVKAPQSNWNHTELRSGPIALTANSVPTPCAMVERAEFRLGLASSNQLRFEGLIDPPPPDAPLFVLLLHSKSIWDDPEDVQRFGHLPGSAYLAYPAPDLRSYVHQINLFKMFPSIVSEALPVEWDEQAHVRFMYRASRAAWQ